MTFHNIVRPESTPSKLGFERVFIAFLGNCAEYLDQGSGLCCEEDIDQSRSLMQREDAPLWI